MASVYLRVDERHVDRPGTPFSMDGNRDYQRSFLVEVSDKRLGPVAVCNAPGLPLPWDFYKSADGLEWDQLALCTKISAKDDGGHQTFGRWVVTANYSTRMPQGGKPEGWSMPDKKEGSQNNPELEPPDVEWEGEVVEKARPYDLGKAPYVNSANQPFKPAHTRPVNASVLIISRNELSFDRKVATKYNNSLNSDTFLGAEPETVRLLLRARMVIKGSLAYWRVTYRFMFGPEKDDGTLETWQPEVIDAGTMELETDPDTGLKFLVPIFQNGVAVTQDVCLDGKGKRKLPDVDGNIEPYYLTFRDYRKKPFNKLFLRNKSSWFGPGGYTKS